MTRILAIHAHPDDVEVLGAGTLALLAGGGNHITIVTMTAGDCGSVEMNLAETGRVRQKEAATAAAIIGADYHCAGFGDLCLFSDDASRRQTTELIRAAKPDVVITASPVDYHPDHEATSMLVRDALFASSVPNYQTGPAAALAAIPSLYFMDPIEGRDRSGIRITPDFGVDITAQFETKAKMLAAHASQRNWVMKQHGIDDYTGSMEKWSAKRGRQYGVAYAEGFRQYRHHPYPATPLLQDLVGDALLTNPA